MIIDMIVENGTLKRMTSSSSNIDIPFGVIFP